MSDELRKKRHEEWQEVMRALEECHTEYPDLRLGQIICNATYDRALFYTGNGEFAALVRAYTARGRL